MTATAGELAAGDVVAVDPEDTLEHAAQLMAERDPRIVVVRVDPTRGRAGCGIPLDARHRSLGGPNELHR